MDYTTLSSDFENWRNELRTYKTDIDDMRSQLEQIYKAHHEDTIDKSVEHFDNLIKLNRKAIADHSNQIKLIEAQIRNFDSEDQSVPQEIIETYNRMEDRVQTASKLYQDMKTEFNQFAEQWV